MMTCTAIDIDPPSVSSSTSALRTPTTDAGVEFEPDDNDRIGSLHLDTAASTASTQGSYTRVSEFAAPKESSLRTAKACVLPLKIHSSFAQPGLLSRLAVVAARRRRQPGELDAARPHIEQHLLQRQRLVHHRRGGVGRRGEGAEEEHVK